jgi:hypothetical protein
MRSTWPVQSRQVKLTFRDSYHAGQQAERGGDVIEVAEERKRAEPGDCQ